MTIENTPQENAQREASPEPLGKIPDAEPPEPLVMIPDTDKELKETDNPAEAETPVVANTETAETKKLDPPADFSVCGLDRSQSEKLLSACNLTSTDVTYRPLSAFEADVSGVGARDKALLRWEAAEKRRAHCLSIATEKYNELLKTDSTWDEMQSVSNQSNRTADIMVKPAAIQRIQDKHTRVSEHNEMISRSIGERQLHTSFVRAVINEQHPSWKFEPKNPAEGKGYAEPGPPGPRQGGLTKPEEHR